MTAQSLAAGALFALAGHLSGAGPAFLFRLNFPFVFPLPSLAWVQPFKTA